jgi:hypothetical protein
VAGESFDTPPTAVVATPTAMANVAEETAWVETDPRYVYMDDIDQTAAVGSTISVPIDSSTPEV